MKKLFLAGSAAALAVSFGLITASPSFSKAHDQGIGDGMGLDRDLSDIGTSNAGGSGAVIGGQGGVSAGVKGGIRGDKASAAGADNSGSHGDVAGEVDDAVRD